MASPSKKGNIPLFKPVDLIRFPGNRLNYITAYHIHPFIRNLPPLQVTLCLSLSLESPLVWPREIAGAHRPSSHVKGTNSLWGSTRRTRVVVASRRYLNVRPACSISIIRPLKLLKGHSHVYDYSRPVPFWMRGNPFVSSWYKIKSYKA